MSDTRIVNRFCTICQAERAMPADVLEGLERAPTLVEETLRHEPDAPGAGWTAREVLAHLADSEIMFGVRVRLILAQTDPEVPSYDEQAWAVAFRYGERDAGLSLETFGASRAATVEILRLSQPDVWQRTYRQPDAGRRTLGELLQHRADHDLQHLRQIVGG